MERSNPAINTAPPTGLIWDYITLVASLCGDHTSVRSSLVCASVIMSIKQRLLASVLEPWQDVLLVGL